MKDPIPDLEKDAVPLDSFIPLIAAQYGLKDKLITVMIEKESSGIDISFSCNPLLEQAWKAKTDDCVEYGCHLLTETPQGRFHKISCAYGLMHVPYHEALKD